ncbi:DNA alkylation repair protein [Rothia nasimurium]|uniref:DNA alkylation repair protein n=1 Tax=Rothia nasimurium TaxID=85336 RepID=UPI001F30357A|nr:DNA alkylation repair protein [Rothia nasimurium]
MNFPALYETLVAAPNPVNAAPMAAYMRNQFPFLGIKTPQRRELIKPLLAEARTEAKTTGIDRTFVEACWQTPEREFQYAALDYLHALRRYLEPEDIDWLRELIEEKSWWDTVDRLDTMVGEILWRNPNDALILAWAQDANLWVRRVAIDHQRPRKAETNTALLEEIITLNFGSREFFINKAIGWSLREYSKTDLAWVADFIARHGTRMAPLSVREGSKRL